MWLPRKPAPPVTTTRWPFQKPMGFRLHVREIRTNVERRLAADQLINALIHINGDIQPQATDLLVGNGVVPLVLVLAYVGKMEVEGDLLLNPQCDLLLAEVHPLRADIENVILHPVEIGQSEGKAAGHVTDMDE